MTKATSRRYYLQREGTEEGPFSPVQINRMKQRGLITAETPCRAESNSTFHRLDEVLPHLKDYTGVDPEKMTKLKQGLATYEIKSLTATAFGAGALSWVPLFSFYGAFVAIFCGAVLLFRHRQPIGLAAILMGAAGFYFCFWFRRR